MVDAPRDEAVQSFPSIAAIDTCAVWNILSSRTLTTAAKGRCHFILAEYVRYECLVKPWKSPERADLRKKLSDELASEKHFTVHSLAIDDLRELAANVSKLGRFHRGELAALALARKLSSGFLTDDRTARKVGENTLGLGRVRTTPHLVGWLVYQGHLMDGDISTIIADNAVLNKRYGALGDFIQVCYEHAMGLRLLTR
ncbi:hypothetical protein [Nitrospirillum sp. BR 11828]|uniref:hypothetical protein n=1 Tax=Nitrospirillum sp. BR 11828 TaxID=3104325 RepID=UPI002ACAC98E|nr:hypothetical protein [Nitrospirillum sp. BR 11828]MDZ5650379.1 hypothetical protein [Nitrospirillum sp. BR 11828]